jgi:tRNA U34 5-carboxymethylaminomethyl modifying GTPase MnmE/TrmE
MSEKRKVGRPKKTSTPVQTDAKPKVSIAVLRDELQKAESFNHAMLHAQIQHETMHKKVVDDFESMLDEAYKEQTAMLNTLYTQLNYAYEHLANIEYHAGMLTIEDVRNSFDIIQRIMHNKFAHKPTLKEE